VSTAVDSAAFPEEEPGPTPSGAFFMEVRVGVTEFTADAAVTPFVLMGVGGAVAHLEAERVVVLRVDVEGAAAVLEVTVSDAVLGGMAVGAALRGEERVTRPAAVA